ncbi:hypothetical protein AAGG74_18610 [Bacillus mexicanus]|uniref:hypothetical protein n=1 Tax=Bacillus mexicanus TaxID=2834415 RepID=UPI003D211D10
MFILSEDIKEFLFRCKSIEPPPLSTGFDNLDVALNGGFRKNNIYFISSLPKEKKSRTILHSAIESAERGAKVLYIHIKDQMFESEENFDLDGRLQKIIWGKKHLFIDKVNYLNPFLLKSKVEHYQKYYGIDIVYIDNIQSLMTDRNKNPDTRSDHHDNANSVYNIALSLNISIVLAANLIPYFYKYVLFVDSYHQMSSSIINLKLININTVALTISKNKFKFGSNTFLELKVEV